MPAMLGRGHTFGLFRQRDFSLFMLNSALWSLGRWMEAVALGWLVLELTDSPMLLGVLTAVRVGPYFLAPLGGGVADRVDRRQLLGLAQLIAALAPLTMGILASMDLIQVWHIFLLMFLAGTATSFAQPTRQALLFDLVGRDSLMTGNALMRGTFRGGFMVGSLLAGIIVDQAGFAVCLLLIAGVNLMAAPAAFLIRRQPRVSATRGESLWANLRQALRFVRSQPAALGLLAIEICFDAFILPYTVLMPIFARDILQVGASGLGILLGATGAGALLGALGMAALRQPWRKGPLLLGSMGLLGMALVLFSVSPWYHLSLLILLGVGVLDSVAMILLPTLLQAVSPDEMRGRVMGLYIFTWIAVPVGGLQAGAVATWLGAPFAVALGGMIVVLLMAALARWVSSLRTLE